MLRWVRTPGKRLRLHVGLEMWRRNFALPGAARHRPTWRKLLNLARLRLACLRLATHVRAYPAVLVIEPTTACNLRCPYCFTGAGGVGRRPSLLPLALYRQLLDEVGAYLFEIRLFCWGEPLLAPDLAVMIADAERRGIATMVNTNLSMALDPARAEALMTSGLTDLTVAIDGGTQETYERYRVGGRLDRVLANCELLAAAKRRTGSSWPRITIEFHPFPWSAGEGEAVRRIAHGLGMEFRLFKGQMPDQDWHSDQPWRYCVESAPVPCPLPWTGATIRADGGVAPCNAPFYREDDMGRLDPAAGKRMFAQVWNGQRLRAARGFFRHPDRAAPETDHPCDRCPQTELHRRYRRHRAAGESSSTFVNDMNPMAIWNHFWRRRPATAPRHHADPQPRHDHTDRPSGSSG